MATQGERQDFKWRPNDNSSTTLTRYDQEAEHWYRAFKNAERKNRPVDFQSVFTFIGLIFSLISSLIVLAVVLLGRLINHIKK